MRIFELFELIKNTPKTTDKLSILKDNMSDLVKEIFEDTYGSQKYYVKKFDVKESGSLSIDENYIIFKALLNDLRYRKTSGNKAIAEVQTILAMFNEDDQKVLKAILDRNLKIGLSLDNFSKVSDSTQKFEVSLAYNLDKVKNVDPIDGTYWASRKLDGTRTICMVDNYYEGDEFKQEVKFLSRSGKEFTTLSNLIEPIKKLTCQLNGTWVLDGECCIMEGDTENFNLLMREVTRKNHTIECPKYNIFDIITLEEFEGKKKSDIFEKRYKLLCELFYESQYDNGVQTHINILQQEPIKSQEDFDRWTKSVSEYGWEGFMLRKNIYYEKGRCKSLLKVKKFQDDEYIVLDVVNGKASYNEGGTKEYDVVSALIISHKGTMVQVGSGLSKEQRLRWYKDPNDIIGKTITVQYFEETVNKHDNSLSLRFPVLKHVYDNGRDI
jgi:DNA ligase-1